LPQAGDEAIGPLAEIAEASLAGLDLGLGFGLGGGRNLRPGSGHHRGLDHGKAGALGQLGCTPRLLGCVEGGGADGHHSGL